MDTRLPAVVQDVGVRATGIFQSVGEDWHPVEGSLVIDHPYQFHHAGIIPGEDRGINGRKWLKGNWPENLMQEGDLCDFLCGSGCGEIGADVVLTRQSCGVFS